MLNTGFFATSATGSNSEALLLDLSPANNATRVTLNPGAGSYVDAVRGISVTTVGPNASGDMEFDVAFLPFNCSFLVSPYFEVDAGGLAAPFVAGVGRRVDGFVTLYEFNNPACYPGGLSYTVRFLPPAGWSGTPDTFTLGGWSDRKNAGASLVPPAGTASGSYSVRVEVRNDTTGATATSTNYTVNVTR